MTRKRKYIARKYDHDNQVYLYSIWIDLLFWNILFFTLFFFFSKLCSIDDGINHQFSFLCQAQQWELHRENILLEWSTIDDGDQVKLCIDDEIKQDHKFLFCCQAHFCFVAKHIVWTSLRQQDNKDSSTMVDSWWRRPSVLQTSGFDAKTVWIDVFIWKCHIGKYS